MHPAAAFLGMSAFGSVAFARGYAAACLAWAMVFLWAAANIAWLFNDLPMMPILDLPLAVSGWIVWHEYRERWQSVFATAFALRLVLHLSYPGHDAPGEVLYLHIMNALFVIACVSIAWKGGADVAMVFYRNVRLRRHDVRVAAHSRDMA